MHCIWGIDLGGTKIEGVVLNADNHFEAIGRLRIPTEAEKGYEHILLQIRGLIGLLSNQTGEYPSVLGIGTPGTTDPLTGLLKNSNTLCLNGKPLRTDLEALLGIPVHLANDANCFALAETRAGIVPKVRPNAEVVFGVILGTGVGGGLVVNGKVIGGSQGIAGEWGHNYLSEEGGPCYCGKTGCVERLISGPALQNYYRTLSGNPNADFKSILGSSLEVPDSYAQLTLERLVTLFGKAIAVVINIIDPDAIVIGGGLGNIPYLYNHIEEAALPHVFNNRLDTLFLKPALGDSAGVFGAAFLTEVYRY